MKTACARLLTALMLTLILSVTGIAQQPGTQKMVISADDAMLFLEVHALIESNRDTLTVQLMMPADQRSAAYKGVDLKSGDQLIMCNGKKVTSPKDLRAMYDSLKVGETVKLGIRRDGHMMLTSFAKADPKDLPGKVVIDRGGPGQGGGMTKEVSVGGGWASADATMAILDGGIVLGPGEKGPVVAAMLPHAAERIKGEMPKEGDVIVTINGEFDTNMKALQALYDEIANGETITVVFNRDGKKHTATYVKAPLPVGGSMMIKK